MASPYVPTATQAGAGSANATSGTAKLTSTRSTTKRVLEN
jgi:hypothetical protein